MPPAKGAAAADARGRGQPSPAMSVSLLFSALGSSLDAQVLHAHTERGILLARSARPARCCCCRNRVSQPLSASWPQPEPAAAAPSLGSTLLGVGGGAPMELGWPPTDGGEDRGGGIPALLGSDFPSSSSLVLLLLLQQQPGFPLVPGTLLLLPFQELPARSRGSWQSPAGATAALAAAAAAAISPQRRRQQQNSRLRASHVLPRSPCARRV